MKKTDYIARNLAKPKENELFTSEEFMTAKTSAMEQLRLVQAALKKIACPPIHPLNINLSHLELISIKELLRDVPTGGCKDDKETDYIYVIKIPECQINLVARLIVKLEHARETAKDFCRINKEHALTNTLYVGRSQKLRSRLKQHLGEEGHTTYAMHLQRWATEFDIQASISYMKFNGVEDLLVQAIEDGLWESLKPAFGRKGGR
jgi:hypothetical protein